MPVNYVLESNGSSWSRETSGDYVFPLALSGTNLHTGGEFTTAGRATVNQSAKWGGT